MKILLSSAKKQIIYARIKKIFNSQDKIKITKRTGRKISFILLFSQILLPFIACQTYREMKCRQCKDTLDACAVKLNSLDAASSDYKNLKNECDSHQSDCSDCSAQKERSSKIIENPKKESRIIKEEKQSVNNTDKSEKIQQKIAQARWIMKGSSFEMRFFPQLAECHFFQKGKYTSKVTYSISFDNEDTIIRFNDLKNKLKGLTNESLILINPHGKKMIFLKK